MSSLPRTPPANPESDLALIQNDLSLLSFTNNSPTQAHGLSRRHIPRDEHLDPLLVFAAFSSGPHVTRHHYHHHFFPDPDDAGQPLWDSKGQDKKLGDPLRYVSRQAPRSERLKSVKVEVESDSNSEESSDSMDELSATSRASSITRPRLDISAATSCSVTPSLSPTSTVSSADLFETATAHPGGHPDVEVKCMARTRIPTPHGPAFLHLYHNNRDNKEHLAIVIDPAQLADDGSAPLVPHIRSQSLDAVWDANETYMDRITRGAYVGRLSEQAHVASQPSLTPSVRSEMVQDAPAPLVRIHSECFTGETIGSMRCDCGEQLDEAIRQISQPVTITLHTPDSDKSVSTTIPGRGAVVYMRQEGRGIGLLSKIRAYNLQDLGHDTVTANLMLGHKADERGYEVAAAIMRDLGLGGGSEDSGVRLLTNNPAKVSELAKEGIQIVERVPMVPRQWQCKTQDDHDHGDEEVHARERASGATLLGGMVTRGNDLEKYLRTKVLRMGHMLSLPPTETSVVA